MKMPGMRWALILVILWLAGCMAEGPADAEIRTVVEDRLEHFGLGTLFELEAVEVVERVPRQAGGYAVDVQYRLHFLSSLEDHVAGRYQSEGGRGGVAGALQAATLAAMFGGVAAGDVRERRETLILVEREGRWEAVSPLANDLFRLPN